MNRSPRHVSIAAAFFVLCIVLRSTAAPSPTPVPDPTPDEAILQNLQSVRLPDEPGTVPLQEVFAQAQEDQAEPEEVVVAPTPEPASPPRILPPLSLQDCLTTLQWAEKQATTKRHPNAIARDLQPILTDVLNYLKFMDDRHSSLAQYDWVFIQREKVSGTPYDQDAFDERTIDDVSAIALKAESGDVYLHYVAVVDEDGHTAAEFNLDPPHILRSGLPRREVFHLYFPTRTQKVLVRYSAVKSGETPRVTAFAGITREREYLKQAHFYVRRAQESLAAGDLQSANTLLSSAARRIVKFQKRY